MSTGELEFLDNPWLEIFLCKSNGSPRRQDGTDRGHHVERKAPLSSDDFTPQKRSKRNRKWWAWEYVLEVARRSRGGEGSEVLTRGE